MKPEYEIYELTCNTIREHLKENIKGYVRVGVDDDTLIVFIQHDEFKFNYTQDNYLDTILKVKTSIEIAEDIISVMHKAVMNKYFR